MSGRRQILPPRRDVADEMHTTEYHLNDLVPSVYGSPHRSQAYSNMETHLRPLPLHLPTVTLTQLLVVPLFSSAHQQPHIKARAHNALRIPRHQSQ